MLGHFFRTVTLLTSLVCCTAQAAFIESDITQIDSDTWQFDFTINNESSSLPGGLGGWFVAFDTTFYSNLIALPTPVAPTGWSNYSFLDTGSSPNLLFFGSETSGTANALQFGESFLNAFSVQVDFNGSGAPGALAAGYNSASFNIFVEGFTTLVTSITQLPAPPPTAMSEPGLFALLMLALVILVLGRKRFVQ